MESLSNFNFLKVIDVKKNNDINANDKNFIGNEKSFITDELDNIENKFNDFLSNDGLIEESTALERKKKQDSKNKLNIFLGLLVFFWFVDFLNRRALLTIEEISFKDRSSTEVIFLDTTRGVFIQTQEIIKY